MKIVLWDFFNVEEEKKYSEKIQVLYDTLLRQGHLVRLTKIPNLKFSACCGCMDCSFKTPGRCRFTDDAELLCREYVNADLVIMCVSLISGFICSFAKKAQERLFPLLLPYPFFESDGLMRLMPRYKKYPTMALIYSKDNNTDDEDVEITKDLMERFANSFKNKLKIFIEINRIENMAYEINSI